MTSGKTSNKNMIFFKTVFFCLFIFSLIMGILLMNIVKYNSQNDSNRIDYIESWTVTDQSGNSFETGRTYNDQRAYTEDFTIVSKLSEHIRPESVLCFMNRSDVRIYIDGKMRYDFDRIKDTGIPGGSLKEFYITVPLKMSDAGAELRIERSKTD